MKNESAKDGLAGAEARIILLISLARLKPCPCYKALGLSFFAACGDRRYMFVVTQSQS
jgi:hypothetical protein